MPINVFYRNRPIPRTTTMRWLAGCSLIAIATVGRAQPQLPASNAPAPPTNDRSLVEAPPIADAARFDSSEPFFSGPQPGEAIATFQVRQLAGDREGQDVDVLGTLPSDAKLMVFVHQVTRPSAALTRLIVDYAEKEFGNAIDTCIVFLTDDPTDTVNFVRRARHAIPTPTLLAASLDGLEGPGAYGLNRKSTLTVLVTKANQVTHNFALIQPAVTDAPAIGAAIAAACDRDESPTLAEMGYQTPQRAAMRNATTGSEIDDATFRSFLAPVIRKTASPEEVEAAVQRVEQHAAENPAMARRLHDVAKRIVDAGKVENYGTAPAQAFLQKWAKTPPRDTP